MNKTFEERDMTGGKDIETPKYIVHDEKDVLVVAVWLAITDDKTWESITDIEQAAYRLQAWEFLDYMVVLHWHKAKV